MGSTRRAFTEEYKASAVEFVINDGRSVADVARSIVSCVRDRVAFRGLNQTTLWGSG